MGEKTETIKKQTELFVDDFHTKHGRSPSFIEIKNYFNLANTKIARSRCISFIGKMNTENKIKRKDVLLKNKEELLYVAHTELHGEYKNKFLDDCSKNEIPTAKKLRDCVKFYYDNEEKRKLDILYKNSLK